MTKQKYEIIGKKPYQYCSKKTKRLNQEVYANTYVTVTDRGLGFPTRFGYSFHKEEKAALNYLAPSWTPAIKRAEKVFVSRKTLAAICNLNEGFFICEKDY